MSVVFNSSQRISRTKALAGNSEFTYMVRFNVAVGNASQTFDLLGEHQSGSRSMLRLTWSNGTLTASLQYSFVVLLIFTNYGTINAVKTGLVPSQWYHVAVSLQDNILSLYVDGVLAQSVSHGENTLTPTSATIGCQRTGNNSYAGYFRGELRDFRLYSIALPGEIVQTISTLNGVDVIHNNIIGRWPMSGPTGETQISFTDISENDTALSATSSITYG